MKVARGKEIAREWVTFVKPELWPTQSQASRREAQAGALREAG